jgi:hypothetical protein
MYRESIRAEDQSVFPLAARLPSGTEQAAIANEMAARRNVKFTTELPLLRERR